MYGASSNGKSSFVQQLTRYLAELGLNIEYVSLEEGAEDTMQQAALRAEWRSVKRKIRIMEPIEFDDFAERVAKPKSADVFVIDTIQYFGEEVRFKQYLKLRRDNPGKLFIYISHLKGKQPDGKAAMKVMRDSSLKNGSRATGRSRKEGISGHEGITRLGRRRITILGSVKFSDTVIYDFKSGFHGSLCRDPRVAGGIEAARYFISRGIQ